MAVSYKKLWHLLLDKDMKKVDLEREAGISEYIVKKLTRNDNVTVEVLDKICKALNCSLDDIMELLPDEKPKSNSSEGSN